MSPSKKSTAGSPSDGEPVFLAIGRLRSAHGVSGEITMEVWTDFPERIKIGSTLFLGETHDTVLVESIRTKGRFLLLGFDGYDDRDQVNQLRNSIVYKQGAGIPSLPEGEYYHHQLIGMKIVTESGETLGKVIEILETGANDVLVVDQNGVELLLPVIKDVIIKVDLPAGEIKVRLPRWA